MVLQLWSVSESPGEPCENTKVRVDHHKLWKILKKMGIPDHLSCLLKNLYAGQEATVRTGHGTKTDSKWGKEYVKEVDLLI